MSTALSTQIQLAKRPVGWPTPDDFQTAQVVYEAPSAGEVRVRNEFVSVDPYMRGRMNDVRSYVAPFALGETITGGAIGRVIVSAAPELPVGTLVLHQHGWSDVVQADASTFRAVPDVPGLPSSLRLHILGMTGLTAYVGLTAIAGLKPGDTVFVSGAAGAVGTAVGQIAKLLGAGRVIGSAGTPEKVALLTEKYGYDAAFNYRDGDVRSQLAAAAPGLLGHLTKYGRLQRSVLSAFRTLAGRHTPVRLIYSETDVGLERYHAYFGADGSGLRAFANVSVEIVPDADHNMSPPAARALLQRRIVEAALADD